VSVGSARTSRSEIVLSGRSLLSVLFFLSTGVEAPEEDVSAGKVTVTRKSDGTVFNWQESVGKVFRVRSSESEPDGASVSVKYRGHWFYIDDSDLTSKTTFSLLNYIFNLKAASKGSREPLLTYPVR
jgi:hypothetical protein